jgi:hypothetical protein
MFCLQADFVFLKQQINTITDAKEWAEIILSAGANMVTVWFRESSDNQASVIVKTFWK